MDTENNIDDELPLLRTSVVVGMVMLLKAHLKTLYGLSEEYGLSLHSSHWLTVSCGTVNAVNLVSPRKVQLEKRRRGRSTINLSTGVDCRLL